MINPFSKGRPSVGEFVEAASLAYRRDDPINTNLTQFTGLHGNAVKELISADGFFASAYENPAGQIIIGFEGTDLQHFFTNHAFFENQEKADATIKAGGTPKAFDDAENFVLKVIAAGQAEHIVPNNIFLSGHSLGGAEAEYASAQLSMGGATFGAPGINLVNLNSNEFDSESYNNLIDYVDWGDPVGNFTYGDLFADGEARPTLEPNIVQPLYEQGLEPAHWGDVIRVGSQDNDKLLMAADSEFGQGQKAAAYYDLGNAAQAYHPLAHYAKDLGVHLTLS